MTETNIEILYSKFNHAKRKVCTDTRKIEPGALFFALKGENFDGNSYARQALDKGCSFAVVSDPILADDPQMLYVKDTLVALQQLANYHRRQFQIPVIAITGSNGKTTTKELTHAVLSMKYNTLATVGNLNNHIGVPLTLLSLNEKHEMAIIEMGANHQGEIALLCEIAEPAFGVITNIGKAHLEGFGGIEGVKKGKGELYKFLEAHKGIAFVHADDAVLMEMAAKNDKVTYGSTKLFDVVGKMSSTAESLVEFKWKTRYNATELSSAQNIKTNLVGKYNYINLLCAACIGNYFRIEEKLINQALSSYVPSNNRSQLFDSGRNKIILDMYNANPTSMQAAIENFSQITAESKVAILGDMLELGEDSETEHENIIQLLKEKKLECCLVGPNFYRFAGSSDCRHFRDAAEAQKHFAGNRVEGKTILLKGSRGIKLEQLLPEL